MTNVLHLLDHDADLQTTRCAAWLRRDAGAGFEVIARTIGRGGAWRGTTTAMLGLRATRQPPNVIHA